jgi:hypothetical protein
MGCILPQVPKHLFISATGLFQHIAEYGESPIV